MSLSSKIDEIRKKPEREKMKYVWGMVAVCMFFIIFVWIISLKGMMKNEKTDNGGGNVFNSLESISESGTNKGNQTGNQEEIINQTNPYYNQSDNGVESSVPATGFSGE